MATAYLLDLRQKILQAVERGAGAQKQIAELFRVSMSFVEKLLIRVRHTGQVTAKKQGGERDTEPVRQARIDYCAQLSPCPAERLKCVDEAGIHIAMSRRFGRAPKGQRVQDAVPKNWGKNVTLLDGLSCQGWKPS